MLLHICLSNDTLHSQQSAAFKILRTRLKTVPSQTFMHIPSLSSSEFGLSAIRRTASAGGYPQILSHIPSIQSSSTSEDGERSSDSVNGPLGINFQAQMKQFEYMQHQHHLYQSQNRPPRRTLTPPPAQVCCLLGTCMFVSFLALQVEFSCTDLRDLEMYYYKLEVFCSGMKLGLHC